MNETPAVIHSEGERMVFQVKSHTNPGKRYRVDLLAMNGAGQCACMSWAMRKSSAIIRREPIGTTATMCLHVMDARRYFLNRLLREMSKQENAPHETKQAPQSR